MQGRLILAICPYPRGVQLIKSRFNVDRNVVPVLSLIQNDMRVFQQTQISQQASIDFDRVSSAFEEMTCQPAQ